MLDSLLLIMLKGITLVSETYQQPSTDNSPNTVQGHNETSNIKFENNGELINYNDNRVIFSPLTNETGSHGSNYQQPEIHYQSLEGIIKPPHVRLSR